MAQKLWQYITLLTPLRYQMIMVSTSKISWLRKYKFLIMLGLKIQIFEINIIIMLSRLSRRVAFSKEKFHEMMNRPMTDIIPDSPEDTILSRFLVAKEEKKGSKQGEGFVRWQKIQNNKLSYNDFLNQHPYGSVVDFTYKNHQMTFVSVNYHRVQERNIHKMLFNIRPDAILLQRRPDYYLHNFNLLPKGDDGIFSDRLYLQQLQFSPQSIREKQKSSSPLTNALNTTRNDVLEQNPDKQILQSKGFDNSIRYASSYQTSLFLGQMPVKSYRQWIANNHTLMQLQEMFKNICRRLPRYKNLNLTPYQMGTLIYPENFMKINDRYMATLLEMMVATKKYKKIVGVFGIVQNQAVKSIMEANEALDPVINLLVPPGPKGNIIRNIENLEIIEKHILLDIMFCGKKVEEIKTKYLHTTNSIIKKYGQQIDKETMMKFRFDKTLEYLQLMDLKIEEGEKEIKKEFIRETIRDPKL